MRPARAAPVRPAEAAPTVAAPQPPAPVASGKVEVWTRRPGSSQFERKET
jgi:hypothetical protein